MEPKELERSKSDLQTPLERAFSDFPYSYGIVCRALRLQFITSDYSTHAIRHVAENAICSVRNFMCALVNYLFWVEVHIKPRPHTLPLCRSDKGPVYAVSKSIQTHLLPPIPP